MKLKPETVDKLKPLMFWFFVAFLIRLTYLFEQGAEGVLFFQPILDTEESVKAAARLLQEGGFGGEPFFKAPLHSIWIAAHMKIFGDGFFYSVRLAQHILGASLAPFAFSIATVLLAPGKGRIIASHFAALLITIHAPLIRLENRLVLDFLVVFFQSTMLWAMIMGTAAPKKLQIKCFIAAGVLAALAWLTRPTLTVVLPFLVLWILGFAVLKAKHRKHRLKLAGLFLAPVLLAVIAFGVRNKIASGETMFLPWQGGYALYHANRDGANGRYYLQTEYKKSKETSNPTVELMTNEYLKSNSLSEIDSYKNMDSWWKDRTKQEVLDNPGRWFGLMINKTLFLTSDREIFNFEYYDLHRKHSTVLSILPGRFGIVWPLAVASFAFLFFGGTGRRKLSGLLILYGVILGGGIVLYYASGRMRMPIVFPAIILAAFGVGSLIQCLEQKKTRLPLVLAPILLIAGIAMSWHNVDEVRTEDFSDVEYIYWSHASWSDGNGELALEYADRAAEIRPDYITIPQLRGQALYMLERFEEAEAAYIESLRRIPDNPGSSYNLTLIQYEHLQKGNEALESAKLAYNLSSGQPRVEWLMARIHFFNGNVEAGDEILKKYDPTKLNQSAPLELLLAYAMKYCTQGDEDNFRKVANMIVLGYQDYGYAEILAESERQGCQFP